MILDPLIEPIAERQETRRLQRALARNARLQYEAASRFLDQTVRRVRPEEDGFITIGAGGDGVRELDEGDLEKLREESRKASFRNPHAVGYLDTLERFVMGRGPDISPELEDERLAGRIEEWWDKAVRVNRWDLLEDEIARRTWRDGETFIRGFVQAEEGPPVVQPDAELSRFLARHGTSLSELQRELESVPEGMLHLRLTPPEQIQSTEAKASHGIVTAPNDVATVLAYVWAPDGKVKEIIPASQMLHVKTGVDSDAKRGRPVLEAILRRLRQYDDWLQYRLALNIARASIVLIKKLEGATASQAAGIRDDQATTRDTTTNSRRLKMFKPMSVVQHGPGIEYEFKTPNLQAQDAQHDGRQILLNAAAATAMPEFMFTADANSMNFATSLAASAPAVREFQSWQDFFQPVFAEIYRWTAVTAAEHDRIEGLSEEAARELVVDVAFAPVEFRDELEHAKANEIRFNAGILSKEGFARDEGIDWSIEEERLAREREEALDFTGDFL